MSESTTPGTGHYVHGTDPEEQMRLARLNDLLNRASIGALAPRAGERTLDFGAGLGQLARAIARATGVRVVGIERSREQIEDAMRRARADGEEALLDLRFGDALAPPLAESEWGRFDLAHTRFLLEHVPDPLRVVRAMVRAVRPGGRIVLEDDDHAVLRLWPEPAGWESLWRAYCLSYERAGNDPFIGRRLVALLADAGAEPVRNEWLFFGGCAGEDDFRHYVANLIGVVEGARRGTVASGAIGDPEFDAVMERVRAWGRRSDAAIWYAMCWAEGRKPA